MSSSSSPDTLPEDKVPVKTKVAFGAANMVGIFTGNLTKELINPVYVVMLGLSPGVVGVAMMIFRFYDAVTDPIMGWISDNTRTRWGRRRPWMLLGAILCALAMPLMWMVQGDWPASWQIAFFIGTGVLLYTCSTIYSVPYESFSLELTPDYKERTRISSFKLVISSVSGLLVGWSWFITQLPIFNDAATGKAATLRSRPFVILVTLALCAVTGSTLWSGIGFFTRLYYTCQGDQVLAAKLNGIQATCWMPISIASVFLFQTISSRWSKTHSLYVALGFAFLSVACRWWTMSPAMPYLSLVSSFLMAAGTTGLWQILPAMNADVVDEDELRTAGRREGAFASIFSWFMKMSFTLGMGLPGLIVGWCGYTSGAGAQGQTPEFIQALRLADVFLPGGLIVATVLLLILYPLSVLETRRGKM
jgi:glycoside/pentoside/hexuronide:cation symporter, GPH family